MILKLREIINRITKDSNDMFVQLCKVLTTSSLRITQ